MADAVDRPQLAVLGISILRIVVFSNMNRVSELMSQRKAWFGQETESSDQFQQWILGLWYVDIVVSKFLRFFFFFRQHLSKKWHSNINEI